MVHSPAVLLAGLAVCSAFASPAAKPAVRAPELMVWLVPPEENVAGLDEKRKQVEPLLRRLLSPDARLRRSKFEDTTPAEVLAARGWQATLPLEDRGAILEEAGKLWPGKLVVEDPLVQPRPKTRPVKAAPVKLAAMAPPTLLGDAAGLVYDGSKLSNAAAPLLAGAADLKDAPAALPAAAVPSTLPGAIRPEVVPPQPGAPAPAKDPRPYADLIAKEAAEAKVDPNILHALITAMGGYKPNRAEGGAYGLMMMTKGSAAWAGVEGDLKDPAVNVRAGARLMAKLLKMFDGDVNRAVAAYRFGAGTVIRSGGLPRGSKDFLAAFQKAYRGGPAKPPVEPVVPPASGETRRAREEARAEREGLPERHGGRQFAGSQKWKGLIARAAGTFGVDPALIESILLSESEGRPSLVSSAGARGLMQLMPGTARYLGVKNSFDPEQNIMGGTRYLKEMLNRFNGNKVLAVAAYNAGPNRQALRDGYVPNFRETVKYVTRVFARYEQITGEKIDSLAYMTGRGRAWAEREGARLARLWGPAPRVSQPVPVPQPRPSEPGNPAGGGVAPPPTADLPEPPASVPTRTATDPSRGRAVGQPWNGRLIDGQRLAPEGEGYRSIRQSRGRFYGTGRLVAGIEWTAKQVRAADPSAPPISIGDLSAKNGGDVSHHRSHENGLDADILLAWKDSEGKPVFAEDFLSLPARGAASYGGRKIYFDVARTWLIVKALATNPHMKVEMAFLDQSLINALLDHAAKAGEDKAVISKASRMLDHWKGHADHMHIRVQ